MEELADSFLFDYVTNSLRKKFEPTAHEGSQEHTSMINTLFAEAYRLAIKNLNFDEEL